MSVTFYLRSTETAYPKCDECGMTAQDPVGGDCRTCHGYGADSIKNGPELNVANGNFVALMDLLSLGVGPDGFVGDIDGAELLMAVAVARSHVSRAVRPAIIERNMIQCGLDASRIERYLDTLEALAALAVRRGEPVVWS